MAHKWTKQQRKRLSDTMRRRAAERRTGHLRVVEELPLPSAPQALDLDTLAQLIVAVARNVSGTR